MARPPFSRTTAVLAWLFGDLTQLNGNRFLAAMGAACLVGLVVGAAVVLLLPLWAMFVLLALFAAGLIWLLRVLACMGWPSPWQ
jgi:hypothetical protein